MSSILVLAEHENGKAKKTACELLSKGGELAKALGLQLNAVVIGDAAGNVPQDLAAYGAKKVFVAEHAELKHYNTEAYTQILADLISREKPLAVLAAASAAGKDAFPRLSARVKAGYASEVTDLAVEGGALTFKRPIYAGKAFAKGRVKTPVQLITVRPNSFVVAKAESGATAERVSVALDLSQIKLKVKEVTTSQSGKVDLTEADRIVSGGRALGSAENFKVLNELADAIGATVGASRAAVDSGYATHAMQVGQTGKVVNPSLYIACGVSGAIQHQAGMRTSKVIVAVNKDPEAAIFKLATYGIVGDLFQVVPMLTKAFKEALAE